MLMIILLFADGIVTIFCLREHQEQVKENDSFEYERENKRMNILFHFISIIDQSLKSRFFSLL